MTKDQFQTETIDFMTRDEQLARNKAAEYNAKGVDDDTIVAVKFDENWCVMLRTTYEFISDLKL